MAKTTQQSSHMLLLILIYKSTTCKVTLSHFSLRFHWWKPKKTSHSRTAIREDRRLLPRTTDFHQERRSTETTKLIETFTTICCFYLPRTLKVS